MKEKPTKRIGFLVFDGLQALDLFGPQEVFAEANLCTLNKSNDYETVIISENGENITTDSGVVLGAHTSLLNCPVLDTLIIPGGSGSRIDKISQDIVDWVEERAHKVRRIGSVCTGLFILARTGLLEGRPVTTHWHNVDEALELFPNLRMQRDALYVRDGNIITAAGVTSGIDMALALVEEDMGVKVAANVARELVVFLRRPGGQNQFSTILRQQSVTNNKFTDLLAWIADNLTEDLSSEVLAARVCLSERHFRRAFKNIYAESPSRTVERIRMDVAKSWLIASRISVEEVSHRVGFKSPDAFRRAFERLTSINPREFRNRFGTN